MDRQSPTLVYVHGAGAQPPEAEWLRMHDRILFRGQPWATTDVAYYADLVDESGEPETREPETREPETGTAALQPPGAALMHRSVRDSGRESDALGFLLRLASALGPDDHRSRFALPGIGIPPGLKEFYRGVSGYVHGTAGLADGMRERLRTTLRRHDEPVVVLAHSLGSLIAFDVLGEPEFVDRAAIFITVGTPLGLGPAQEALQAWRSARPIEIPTGVAHWRNFHASGDAVAMGSGLDGLRSDYGPGDRIHATEVRNDAEWHHALDGYLAAPEVQDAVVAHLLVDPRTAAEARP